LSEAINSMYQWYANAGICIVYLFDVSSESGDIQSPEGAAEIAFGLDETTPQAQLGGYNVSQFKDSKWFTRGWTLQELIAPSSVLFLDKK
jgi:hypothetical protein